MYLFLNKCASCKYTSIYNLTVTFIPNSNYASQAIKTPRTNLISQYSPLLALSARTV